MVTRRGWRFATAILFVLLIWGGVLASEFRTPQFFPQTAIIPPESEPTRSTSVATSGTITIGDVYVLATELSTSVSTPDSMGSMPGMDANSAVSSAYMTLTNTGSSTDTLISLTSDAATTTDLHETIVTNNIAQMIALSHLTIPAGTSVMLKPGGYHAMLNNLKYALLPGQNVTLTLTFASGTVITVNAPVRAP